jgi:hypothetical protein
MFKRGQSLKYYVPCGESEKRDDGLDVRVRGEGSERITSGVDWKLAGKGGS